MHREPTTKLHELMALYEQGHNDAQIRHNISIAESLIDLAAELLQDRCKVATGPRSWMYVVPDINYTTIEEQLSVLLARIPKGLPHDYRKYVKDVLTIMHLDAKAAIKE